MELKRTFQKVHYTIILAIFETIDSSIDRIQFEE